jgi:hypothetical protein
MCPVCIAAAALLAGKVTSTGGAAAIVIKKFGGKKAVKDSSGSDVSTLSGKENAAEEIVSISNPRRDVYVDHCDGEREDRVA